VFDFSRLLEIEPRDFFSETQTPKLIRERCADPSENKNSLKGRF